MGWTIKQAAELTGIPADTLRYYDKEGMVSPRRSEGGYRIYDDEDITHLKNVVVMKYAHFSIAEMKSMEELHHNSPGASCNEISKGILNTKITELRQAVANYQNIIALLEELLPMLDNAEAYRANAGRIGEFIDQIFRDIRGGSEPQSSINRKEA